MLQERLKMLRKQKGVNQESVADAVGVSKSAYGYYEAGRNMPGVDVLIKLAQHFEVTTDYLLNGVREPDDENNKIQDDDEKWLNSEIAKATPEKRAMIKKFIKAIEDEDEKEGF